jgi:hypothetical protein
MSAPVPLHYADNGDSTERKKDQTQTKVPPNPDEAGEEQRNRAEQKKVARFSVHFGAQLKGAATRLPPSASRWP